MSEICLKKESLIMVKNSLDKNQMFVFNVMIKALSNNLDYIDINEVCKSFNMDYENAKKIIVSLIKLQIIQFQKENSIFGAFVPIYQIKFIEGRAYYKCSEMFLEILQQKGRYTLIDLHIQRLLPSKYSYIFYEIASLCFNTDKGVGYTEKYTFEEIKKLLGLNNEDYPEYKIFKRNILKKNLISIEEHTEYQMTLKELKSGNKVNQIYFEIRKKGINENKTEIKKIETTDFNPKKYSIYDKKIESEVIEIDKIYTPNQIQEAKIKLEKAKQTTEIKNEEKYLQTILKNTQDTTHATITPETIKELKYKYFIDAHLRDSGDYFIEMEEPYKYYNLSHLEESIAKMREYKKFKNVKLGNVNLFSSSDTNKCYLKWGEYEDKFASKVEFLDRVNFIK